MSLIKEFVFLILGLASWTLCAVLVYNHHGEVAILAFLLGALFLVDWGRFRKRRWTLRPLTGDLRALLLPL